MVDEKPPVSELEHPDEEQSETAVETKASSGPNMGPIETEAVETPINGEDGDSDNDGTDESNLFREFKAFMNVESAPLLKTKDFNQYDARDLGAMLQKRIEKKFPDLQIFETELNDSKECFFAHFPDDNCIIVITHIATVEFEIDEIEDRLRRAFVESSRRIDITDPEFRTYLVCFVDIQDDENMSKSRDWKEQASEQLPSVVFPIWPEQAWTLLFGPDTPSSTAPSARMVSDAAIDNPNADKLNFDPYADAIFGLIDHPDTNAPMTMAINAKWGMGKTSLAKLVEYKLRTKPASWNARNRRRENPHATYWFNAWMHDEADKLAAAFMADIMRQCHGMMPLWRRLFQPLPDGICGREALMRRRATLIGFGILAVGWTALQMLMGLGGPGNGATKLPFLGEIVVALKTTELQVGGTLGLLVTAFVANFAKLRETGKTISAYVGAPAEESNFGSLGRVREQLTAMIRRVTPEGSKFVVFIDDLERCRNTHAVDVLEVVNQLLSFDPVVTVVVADMPAVATCVEIKYKDIAARYDPSTETTPTTSVGTKRTVHTYGRLFLQKFIQLQFHLPRAVPEDLKKFSNEISAPDGDAEDTETDERPMGRFEARMKNIARGAIALAGTAWCPPEERGGALPNWIRSAGLIGIIFLPFFCLPLLMASWLQRLGLRLASVQFLRKKGIWYLAAIILTLGFQFLFILLLAISVVRGFDPKAFAASPAANWEPLIFSVISVIQSAVIVLLAPGIWLLGWLEKRGREGRRARMRVEGGNIDPHDEVAVKAFEQLFEGMDKDDRAAILREIGQRNLNDESEWFEGARTEALNESALAPRNIKRLINRLRLLLFILNAKNLLNEDNGLTPGKVGNWVAFQELWPEYADAVRQDPKFLEAFEKTSGDADWKELVAAYGHLYSDTEKLKAFITKEPHIGAVSKTLTMFSTAHATPG
jgi:hypothetical protein